MRACVCVRVCVCACACVCVFLWVLVALASLAWRTIRDRILFMTASAHASLVAADDGAAPPLPPSHARRLTLRVCRLAVDMLGDADDECESTVDSADEDEEGAKKR